MNLKASNVAVLFLREEGGRGLDTRVCERVEEEKEEEIVNKVDVQGSSMTNRQKKKKKHSMCVFFFALFVFNI